MQKVFDFIIAAIALILIMLVINNTHDFINTAFQDATWNVQEVFCLFILIPGMVLVMYLENRKGKGDEE